MATEGFSATTRIEISVPSNLFSFGYVRRQNAALKSDGFGILLAGLLRLILHRDFKVALVLSVVCIRVKGFFCGSVASALLWLFRCGDRRGWIWVRSWHHAPLQEPFDIFAGSWYTTSNPHESVGGGWVAFPVLSCS